VSRKRSRRAPKNPWSAAEPLVAAGDLIRSVKEDQPRALPARLALRLMRWIPTSRDTQRGRANAAQVKVLLVGLGVLLGAVGKTTTHMIIGALFMVSALLLPVAEWRKRGWRARLKASTRRTREVSVPVEVLYDAKRLAVLENGKVWRRVLVDRGSHRTILSGRDGTTWFGVVPASGRKSESLWFRADFAPPRDAPEPDLERVDQPIVLTADDLETLVDTLSRWSPAQG